ncbi:MAG: 7-methylguanosine phosphate-specific 5'-nucleotidase, partial [Paramarteilia canceri]
ENDKTDKTLLIISGGIKNIIERKLSLSHFKMEDITVISNEIDGKTKTFNPSKPLITTANKGACILPEFVKNSEIELFFVAGDSIMDSEMITRDRINSNQSIFRFGFVNMENIGDTEELKATMNRYSESFDALVLNDDNFSSIYEMIKQIISENK